MYLARLKKYGPKLLCVVTLTEELALKQAAAADAEIKRGKYRGPLHGIPWGAKDLFATKGIKTTWGAEPYRDQVIDYDSTVVERLNEAGAVLVAKLSMGALAQGARWFAGVTRNPWQPDEAQTGSSGSSAGPAAATAAGLVGFSIGTETLGSIVSPSSRCGVTGLRPTYGRVSRYGAMGLSWTMDKIGPICRGVEDCAAALTRSMVRTAKTSQLATRRSTGTRIQTSARCALVISRRSLMGQLLPPQTSNSGHKLSSVARFTKTRSKCLEKAGAKLTPIELPKFSAGSLRFILSRKRRRRLTTSRAMGASTSCQDRRRAIGPTRSAPRVSFRRLNTCARNVRARC